MSIQDGVEGARKTEKKRKMLIYQGHSLVLIKDSKSVGWWSRVRKNMGKCVIFYGGERRKGRKEGESKYRISFLYSPELTHKLQTSSLPVLFWL